jgi:hypothetical protein
VPEVVLVIAPLEPAPLVCASLTDEVIARAGAPDEVLPRPLEGHSLRAPFAPEGDRETLRNSQLAA